MRSEFYIACDKAQHFLGKRLDWFIKSWEYGYGSDEWKICRLKKRIYMKKALNQFEKANKHLNVKS